MVGGRLCLTDDPRREPRCQCDRPKCRSIAYHAGTDQAAFYKDVQHVQDTTTDPKVQEFVYCWWCGV